MEDLMSKREFFSLLIDTAESQYEISPSEYELNMGWKKFKKTREFLNEENYDVTADMIDYWQENVYEYVRDARNAGVEVTPTQARLKLLSAELALLDYQFDKLGTLDS